MKKLKTILLGLIIPVLVIIFWWYATNYGNTPESILPKISTVGKTIGAMWTAGTLQEDLLISMQRL